MFNLGFFDYVTNYITTIELLLRRSIQVWFYIEQLRRPDLIGKLVEGSHTSSFFNSIQQILDLNTFCFYVEPLRGSF